MGTSKITNYVRESIDIILVEDHPEYREVVELALSKEPDIRLVSQFGTAEMALRSLQDISKEDAPHIILLDLNLPGASGLDSIRWFKEYAPTSKIIILTQSDREADILHAITLGASGYLLKASSVNQIKQGIRTVMNGGASLDPGVAKFIIDTLKLNLPEKALEKEITDREMEVLTLLAQGLVKKEISDRLGIGISTVVTHVGHIYEKLQVSNAPSAIDKAHRIGLFSKR